MASNALNYNFRRLEEIAESLIDWEDGMRCHHISFIIYKKRIISIGANRSKTHPANLLNRKVSFITGKDFSDEKHTCSEFTCISKLKKKTNIDTKRCTLVNIRYDRNKRIALAKPCMSCRNLLKYFEFKKVIWTTNEGSYECD